MAAVASAAYSGRNRAPFDEASLRVVFNSSCDLTAASSGTLVFTSPDGTPIRKSNFLRRSFHPTIKKAGVPRISFHALRHTSNTLLLLGGTPPNVVAQRMGHSSTRMTLDVYGHVLTGAQRAAADLLDGVFGNGSREFGGQMVVKSLPGVDSGD